MYIYTHQEAFSEVSSIPLCNIGLNFKVSGNGTLADLEMKCWIRISTHTRTNTHTRTHTHTHTHTHTLAHTHTRKQERTHTHTLITNPENVQLIHPPSRTIGNTFMNMFFIISVAIEGSTPTTPQHTAMTYVQCTSV